MRIIFAFLLLAGIPFVTGCNSLLLPPEPSQDPIAVFDQFFGEFNLRYANFPDRHVNWDSLKNIYRPQLTSLTPDSTLGAIMDSMIVALNDAHVALETSDRYYRSNSKSDTFPYYTLDAVSYRYIRNTAKASPSGNLVYGRIDDSIGYLRILTFSVADNTMGWESEIDPVLAELAKTKALIIDIRENSGGSASIMQTIAKRFLVESAVYSYVQVRSGPSYTDLSAPLSTSIQAFDASSTLVYRKPVYLLIHRHTVSAAEWFTLALKTQPQVITYGDTTSGNFSSRLDRELQNGWHYSLSYEHVSDKDHICHEGVGIAPDVVIHIGPQSLFLTQDPALEKAVRAAEHK